MSDSRTEDPKSLVARLRRCGVTVFLAAEEGPARDISAHLTEAANRLELIEPLLVEARLLLDEVQARHASDPLPGRVYKWLQDSKS